MINSFKICTLTAAALGLLSAWLVGGVWYPNGATTLHFAFDGSPNGDRPIIRPPATYYPEDGFGFVDSPTLIGTSRGVTAPKYFRFDTNLPPGNYEVTIVIGGTQEESVTTVKAEGRETSVVELRAARGQTATKAFNVTVKAAAAGQASDKSLDSDARLNLEFVGTNPSLMKLDIKPATPPATAPAK